MYKLSELNRCADVNAANKSSAGLVPPRILELGEFCLFKRTWPETTAFYFSGPNRDSVRDVAHHVLKPWSFPQTKNFDLVVVYPPLTPGFDVGTLCGLLQRGRWRESLRLFAWAIMNRRGPGGRQGDPPLVVLDMHDEREIFPHNFALADRCQLYFKRELPADPAKAFPRRDRDERLAARVARLRPISLGMSQWRLAKVPPEASKKTIDVFFSGALEHAPRIRGPALEQLEALSARGYRVDILRERVPLDEFMARCARAWLTLSPEGLGWDCFRHYEAGCCRSVPLINQPSIRRYEPLRDGVHALYYEVEGDDLTRVIVAALQDRPNLAAMAEAARQHILKHHRHEDLCRYVVETITGCN